MPMKTSTIISDTMTSKSQQTESKPDKRHMSRNQEIWNAVTMIFPAGIGIHYLLSSGFISEDDILRAEQSPRAQNIRTMNIMFGATTSTGSDDQKYQCISSPYFPSLHALPPIATISVALGYILHSPCSMFYHYLCAFKLDTAPQRMHHWSRRLDQSMIHILGCFVNFGISGSIAYCLMTLAFSVDSIVRLFKPGFRPKENQIRMVMTMLCSVMPAVIYGYYDDASKIALIYAFSAWIFAKYPFGGYSHGIFHLVAAMATPIQLGMSTRLIASQEALDIAAKCTILARDAGLSMCPR